MKIVVTDRAGIEAGVLVRSSYVVISIRDPEKRRAKVRRQSGLKGVLYLSFHDAEPAADSVLPGKITLMTANDARRIRAFVERHRGEAGAVVVHCEAGMSRSPAVAAALARWLGDDEGRFHREYQPNRHVYGLVVQACGGSNEDWT